MNVLFVALVDYEKGPKRRTLGRALLFSLMWYWQVVSECPKGAIQFGSDAGAHTELTQPVKNQRGESQGSKEASTLY